VRTCTIQASVSPCGGSGQCIDSHADGGAAAGHLENDAADLWRFEQFDNGRGHVVAGNLVVDLCQAQMPWA
jgi:hypothetical protein